MGFVNIIHFNLFKMSSDSDKLIVAIQDKTQAISFLQGLGQFINEIKFQLKKFANLQILTLNDCGIQSLQNFPFFCLINTVRYGVQQNQGEDLKHLTSSRHLQTLTLGANQIQKIQNLEYLKPVKQLLQFDLINNPIQKMLGQSLIQIQTN